MYTRVDVMVFYHSCAVLGAVCIIVTVSYECDRNCKECKNSTCSECHYGYFLSRTGICQICTKNCKTCLNETTCKTCMTGSFPHPNGHCEPCAEDCFMCVNETNCTFVTLNVGSKMENARKCQDNCNKCDENNECSQCNKGFYVNNGTCESCSPLCLGCSSYDNCTECISGSWGPICNETCFYVNNYMSKCKDKKCDQEMGECTECEKGAFGAICEKTCANNCHKGTCDKHGRCLQGCRQGFYGDACRKSCPMNCRAYVCAMSGQCTQGCKAGYYGIFCNEACRSTSCVNSECLQTNGTCIQQCPQNCRSCTSETKCNLCNSGYYGNKCEHSCTDCIDDRCSLLECKRGCKEGLYNDRESCKPCRRNCFRCTSFDQCDECLDGWYGPTCQLECNRTSCFACEIDSNHCTKCKPGYTLRNNNCCPENCLNCNGDGRCLTCYDGFYGDTCNRSCMKNCKTCSSRDNCTECRLRFYDSKSDLEAGLCLCDERECEEMNRKSCLKCKQSGWYARKRGCCPCPKHCKNQSDCKLYTGNCKTGCEKGWFGSHCDKRCTIEHCVACRNYDTCQQCENGYYGQACQYNCSLGCVQSSEGPLCDTETGHCLHGCTNGTWGKTCNRTCSNNCVNGYCNSRTGHCLKCESTHFGLNCENKADSKIISNNSMVTIIAVCVAVLCIVVFVVAIVIRKRSQRGNQDKDIDKGSIEMDAVGTTPAGARGRRKSNPDDEVITENAMYEPFQPLYMENNAQNALVAKSGSSGDAKANDYEYTAPNDPDSVYSLPIKSNSRA